MQHYFTIQLLIKKALTLLSATLCSGIHAYQLQQKQHNTHFTFCSASRSLTLQVKPSAAYGLSLENQSSHYRLYMCCRIHSLRRIAQAEKYFNDIPSHHQRMVPSFGDTLLKLQQAVDQNYLVVKQIIRSADKIFENRPFQLDSVCTCHDKRLYGSVDCDRS